MTYTQSRGKCLARGFLVGTIVVFGITRLRISLNMAFYDDEEKEKGEGTVSEDALGEVFGVDEDADDEDTPIVPPVEEDEKWE